ncbi:MAG: hypothetical protein GY823_12240, partial [Flavobacteriaceae bacterium]|nr:hypothetical protein [Flavobacteriaceae bacterium]
FYDNDKEVKGYDNVELKKILKAINGGFDFDDYASFRKDDYKALIGITREINAICGIIFTSLDVVADISLSLGVGDELASRLRMMLSDEEIKNVTDLRNLLRCQVDMQVCKT